MRWIQGALFALMLLRVPTEAKPKAPSATDNVRLYTPTLVYSAKILFEYEKANLRESSEAELERLTALLVDNASLSFEVVIYKQKPAGAGYGYHLGQRRAQALIAYLVKGGIEPERLSLAWYEERCPKAKPGDKVDTRLIDLVVRDSDVDGCRPYEKHPPAPKGE